MLLDVAIFLVAAVLAVPLSRRLFESDPEDKSGEGAYDGADRPPPQTPKARTG